MRDENRTVCFTQRKDKRQKGKKLLSLKVNILIRTLSDTAACLLSPLYI